jgi:hypothetical protein
MLCSTAALHLKEVLVFFLGNFYNLGETLTKK